MSAANLKEVLEAINKELDITKLRKNVEEKAAAQSLLLDESSKNAFKKSIMDAFASIELTVDEATIDRALNFAFVLGIRKARVLQREFLRKYNKNNELKNLLIAVRARNKNHPNLYFIQRFSSAKHGGVSIDTVRDTIVIGFFKAYTKLLGKDAKLDLTERYEKFSGPVFTEKGARRARTLPEYVAAEINKGHGSGGFAVAHLAIADLMFRSGLTETVLKTVVEDI
jgi:hypothetical protein